MNCGFVSFQQCMATVSGIVLRAQHAVPAAGGPAAEAQTVAFSNLVENLARSRGKCMISVAAARPHTRCPGEGE